MEGDSTGKSILTMIRGFASEKHQGERRVVNLKKRIDELESELDRAYEEVENAKRRKEKIEQEFRGYEVELAIKQASAQALEARITPYQEQISTVNSDLQALKNEEGALRDEFIKQMLELNNKIRRTLDSEILSAKSMIHGGAAPGSFTESDIESLTQSLCSLHSRLVALQQLVSIIALTEKYNHSGNSKTNDQDPEVAILEEQMSGILSQIATEEKACEEERNHNIVLQQELTDARRKLNLMETVIEDMKELQELTKQTSELERVYAELGEELQRKCICPSCQQFNVEGLEGFLQGIEGSSPSS